MLNKFLLQGREMDGREGVREEGRRKRKANSKEGSQREQYGGQAHTCSLSGNL